MPSKEMDFVSESFCLPDTFMEEFHNIQDVKRMRYSTLGATGMRVSALGFGAAPIGGVYQPISDQEAVDCVSHALRRGINYIDTAPWYGQGKSEEMLGKALKEIPRKTYYIGTKVGRYKQDVGNMFDFSAKRVLRSVDESLALLGLPSVDIIQVHDVEFAPSPEKILYETLPALEKVRSCGKAKFIGITGYPIQSLRYLLEHSKVKIDVVLSYCHLCLNDSTLLDHLDYFEDKGVGVINASPLSMGLLTSRGPPDWHCAPKEIRQRAWEATVYCKSKAVDIARLAIHHTLSHQEVPVTLCGIGSKLDADRNLEVLHNGLSSDEENVKEHIRERFFQSIKEKSWGYKDVEKYWQDFNALKK